MASLPPQQSARRRSSPDQAAASTSRDGGAAVNADRPTSTSSEDSQTIVVDAPSQDAASQAQASPPPRLRRQDTDVRKCWICFSDETEDTPQTSRWRSPCPCALVAHEECLLDWIADMESPASRKRATAPPKIQCPQCKSDIRLARPYDPVVESVKAMQRLSARVTTPSILAISSWTIIQAFTFHGIHTVFQIFGPDDGLTILKPYLTIYRQPQLFDLEAFARNLQQHWRLHFGLPLITPVLVLSRTTLADSVLPILPILFFATQNNNEHIDLLRWPPSASLAVSVLPYIRSLYNAYYARVWAPHEKRWLKEIQPRLGQSEEGQAENAEPAEPNGDGNDDTDDEEGDVFEIRVDGNLWDFNRGENDEQAQGQDGPVAPQQDRPEAEVLEQAANENTNQQQPEDGAGVAQNEAPPLDAPPLADAQQPLPDVAAQPPPDFFDDDVLEHVDVPRQRPAAQAQPAAQPAAAAAVQQNQERRLSLSTTGLAEKLLGALIFPTIANLSGELIRLIVPLSWTTPPTLNIILRNKYFMRSMDSGLLQRRWGRSIVGGCLFVVFKDAIMLYVRWRMAQQHRSRKILNYDGKRRMTSAR